MSDVAVLGLQVDSSQVKTATTNLTALANAAKATAPAVKGITDATNPAAVALANMQSITAKAASAHAGLSTQAMAAGHAVRSMTEGIALGMPPTQILAQQLGHLSYAASGEGGLSGAFKSLGSSLSAFISPSKLVIASLGAIGVGGLLAYSAIAKTEEAFGELSERSGTSLQSLHALNSAGGAKGINTADMLKGMEQFNVLTDQAKNGLGSLADLFQANGVATGTLDQNLAKAADLIQNAATEQQKYSLLQQLGLPATREWVQFLGQGSVGLQQATAAAVQFGEVADRSLIDKARQINDSFNGISRSVKDGIESYGIEIFSWIGKISEGISELGLKAGISANAIGTSVLKNAIFNGTATNIGAPIDPAFNRLGGAASTDPAGGASKPTVDPNAIKAQIALEQQRIGVLGQLASIEDIVKQTENQISLARLTPHSLVTDSDLARVTEYARATALGVTAIRTSADAYRVQGAAVGMGIAEATSYNAVQTRINEESRKGNSLGLADVARLTKEADALGKAAQSAALLKAQSDLGFAGSQIGRSDQEQQVATQLRQLYGDDYQSHLNDSIAGQIRLNDSFLQTKSVSESALSGFLQDLRDGKSTLVGMQDVLVKFENKLFDIASNQVISGLFGALMPSASGAAAGGTSIFASLGKVFGFHSGGLVGMAGEESFTRMMDPGLFANAPRFHDGGLAGDEVAAVLRKGEGVFTPAQMSALGSGGGGGGVTVHAPVNVTLQGGGVGDDAQARKFAGMIAQNVRTVALQAIRDQKRSGGLLA